MERRDYLMTQIQEMGFFLAKLVRRLRGLDDSLPANELFSEAGDALSTQFGWDLEELLFMEDGDFIRLMEENLLAEDHYEKMAQVFELLGDTTPVDEKIMHQGLYYRKALAILRYLDLNSHTYSMERQTHIGALAGRL